MRGLAPARWSPCSLGAGLAWAHVLQESTWCSWAPGSVVTSLLPAQSGWGLGWGPRGAWFLVVSQNHEGWSLGLPAYPLPGRGDSLCLSFPAETHPRPPKPDPVKSVSSVLSSLTPAKAAPVINNGSPTILGKRSYEQHNGVDGEWPPRPVNPGPPRPVSVALPAR